MRDLFEFLELPLVPVPEHPWRKTLVEFLPPDERGGVTGRRVTEPDWWTLKALDALTRLHRAKLPLTSMGLLKWLKAGNAESCSPRTVLDALVVIQARDDSGMEETTMKDHAYIDRIIHERMVATGCGHMSIY